MVIYENVRSTAASVEETERDEHSIYVRSNIQ